MMSVKLDVYYSQPRDVSKEQHIASLAAPFGGVVEHAYEITVAGAACSVEVWVEFDSWDQAERAELPLQKAGFHVEGPSEYG